MPSFSISLSISWPVKPARKPRAVLSMPRFLNTIETLMPFPPGNISS